MKCPVDSETLVMTDRSGVEIDYCPKCRGVWLDRGELDKIIDRAGAGAQPSPAAFAAPAAPPTAAPHLQGRPQFEERTRGDERYRDRHDDDDDYHRHGKKKRRESFLGDLFDF